MSTADYTGKTLDEKYEVIELIGEGGMGAVYRGRHVTIGKPVAIKFLHAALTGQEEVVKRFYREAQAAAAIRHSNIIDVMDLGVSPEGEPYLVMEFLEGEGLADFLEWRGTLDLATACGILEAALAALEAAHAQGIVHRDLKPDNIFLVNRPGEPLGIKLIDFGISKFLAMPDQTKLTQDGSMLGTPAYMSPEQARGLDAVDHRTDLYAIGVIMYQMLAGKVPFSGVNYSELLLNMLSTDPADPTTINPDFPAEAKPLVDKALMKEPADRFQSAAEMLNAIRALSGNEERAKHLTMLANEMTAETLLHGAPGDPGSDDTHYEKNMYSRMLKQRETSAKTSKTGAGAAAMVAVTAGFRGITKASLLVYKYVKTARWPRTAGAFTLRLATRIVRHPKRVVPISVFGAIAALLLSLPLLCSEPTPEVTITLKNVPENATVYFDDDQVSGASFSVSKQKSPAEIRVEADGKRPFSKKVIPNKNRTINVVLRDDKSDDTRSNKQKAEPEPAKADDNGNTPKEAESETDAEKDTKKTKRRRIRWKNPFRKK